MGGGRVTISRSLLFSTKGARSESNQRGYIEPVEV